MQSNLSFNRKIKYALDFNSLGSQKKKKMISCYLSLEICQVISILKIFPSFFVGKYGQTGYS